MRIKLKPLKHAWYEIRINIPKFGCLFQNLYCSRNKCHNKQVYNQTMSLSYMICSSIICIQELHHSCWFISQKIKHFTNLDCKMTFNAYCAQLRKIQTTLKYSFNSFELLTTFLSRFPNPPELKTFTKSFNIFFDKKH